MSQVIHQGPPPPARSGVKRGYLMCLVLLLAAGLATMRSYQSDGDLADLWTDVQQHPWVAFWLDRFEKPPAAPEAIAAVQPQVQQALPETTGALPPRKHHSPHFLDPAGDMDRFFEALFAVENGTPKVVRALYYSTSEIGYDRVTSQIRRILQERFGDGGKGFFVIGPAWRIQAHQDLLWKSNNKWSRHSIRGGELDDGHYGLGGILNISQDDTAWVEYATVSESHNRGQGYHPFPAGTKASRFELFYRAHPGGGTVQIQFDDEPPVPLPTHSDTPADKVFYADLEDGPHKVQLRPDKSPTRLYGAVLERERGFVLDALMVIGQWAYSMLNFDPEHIETQVAQRAPDLIIFQLGAKEAYKHPNLNQRRADQFGEQLTEAVRRIRKGRPEASCLVIATKDMGMLEQGRIVTRPAIPRLVAAAEKAAQETRCAFFNLYEALGGEGTMRRWRQQDPPLVTSDLGHLMLPGALEVGSTVATMLLQEYEAWRVHQRASAQAQLPTEQPAMEVE